MVVKCGWDPGLGGSNPGVLWRPRQPVVVSKAWNHVDVKVELMMVEAAKGAVIQGLYSAE